MVVTQNAPASMYRGVEGLGIWEHRGKVAAVGIGHSPTARRWDERSETSIGAWSLLALRGYSVDRNFHIAVSSRRVRCRAGRRCFN